MKLKACPLLAQSNTSPSMTVNGESYTRTFFLRCLGEECAAFLCGECKRFETFVTLPDPPEVSEDGE